MRGESEWKVSERVRCIAVVVWGGLVCRDRIARGFTTHAALHKGSGPLLENLARPCPGQWFNPHTCAALDRLHRAHFVQVWDMGASLQKLACWGPTTGVGERTGVSRGTSAVATEAQGGSESWGRRLQVTPARRAAPSAAAGWKWRACFPCGMQPSTVSPEAAATVRASVAPGAALVPAPTLTPPGPAAAAPQRERVAAEPTQRVRPSPTVAGALRPVLTMNVHTGTRTAL